MFLLAHGIGVTVQTLIMHVMLKSHDKRYDSGLQIVNVWLQYTVHLLMITYCAIWEHIWF